MNKDTRFSIRKLTVGVASIAVASFLTSGSVDAADLSILHSKDEKAAGYNPELPFEPFPPSISYTQPEAPWVQESLDTELSGDDVEEVTEPNDVNYVNPEAPFAPVEEEVTEPRKPNYKDPEAPFAPVEEVTEPRKPNYEDPEAPFAPVEEDEEVTEPRKPNYKDPEAPFAPVEDEEVTEPRKPNYKDPEAPFAPVEDEEATEPRKPNYENPEAPFAPVEEDEEVIEPRKPNYANPEAPFAPVEEDEEVTEPRKPNYEDPEAPFAPVEEDEEVTEPRKPNYEDPEAPFAPVEEDEEVTEPRKPNYKDPEAPFAPVEEEEEDSPTLEVKVVQETETLPYETERRENADLYVGDEEIIIPGQEGKVVKEFEVTYAGDKEVSRKELRVVESVDPVTEIIESGTKPVMTTGTEKHQVEEALPVVEKEDPELLEGQTRTEDGSPKVTEITEEITYERGKEVSRETIKEEVIDEGTAEIKYVGTKRVETITETETLPYETERKENPDLYEDEEKVVQEGQEGKITKEYEVTYIKGEEVDRQEGRVVESVDPVTEIVEYGTKPVKETKEETRRVEEVLPVVEKEDPELLEGQTRTEQGTPKVTKVTEEITYERGKEVSREKIKEEVIDQGTAAIKYIGIKRAETITETETIPYETERKENPNLYEDEEKVVQEGQEGKITKEYEVTYIKGEEEDRQEVRVVENVEPVTEIVEYGTKPVKETKEETRRVEEVLPVVEKEDPELLEGQTRTEAGSPIVTEITEEIIFERGKEVSRRTIKEEVIDQGTAEIKYIGIKRVETIIETETIPYETERKENPDLYEDEEKVVQEGQEGKITKEYEVTYIKGEEEDRQEGRVVESVDPVKEIIEFGTKPVMTTGTEKHQVEEVLPVVEKEDPELLEGQTRTEAGSPKVTEITEEITYERGKEVSRETIKEEVIDEGTAEIKYVGTKRVETITETETLPYETERKENPDLYEDEEKVVQEGQEGKITKEYEVTYIKGEEEDRQEGRVVESVDPVKEIIEFGTKPVMTTGTEKHQVEEALPVVEKEDPELLEGQTRTEDGSPKVTEITEEITYERGKEVSRKTTKEEVIDEGTAEIKYIGTKRVETITETETLPYEKERKENPDLYEDEEKVAQEGQEGKITKEYEVTYIKGKEVDRQEGRVVESVDPVNEIIEFGTKPVMTTGTEKHQVKEALPVVEKEDPELLEGENRTEPGSPKVTEITEEITYERGKEVSRKVINREVIDEGTASIKYTGIKRVETITETETLTPETERRENPDLYEGTECVIQEGKEGSVTKEYEVTYIKGKETNRQEVRVVERVDPVTEIIEVGTKKDQLVKWTVDYGTPEPSEEALGNVLSVYDKMAKDVDEFGTNYQFGAMTIALNPNNSERTQKFYLDALAEYSNNKKKIVLASILDYYRKSKDDETIIVEDIVKASKGNTGGFYETLVLAAAEKLGITEVQSGQTAEQYKRLMVNNMMNKDMFGGKNLYKDVMNNGDFGAYAPRLDAKNTAMETLNNLNSLLDHWQESFKTITNDETITRQDTLARTLEYYRQLSNQPQATLREAIEDLANYSFSKEGMKALVNHYDPTLEQLSDKEAYKKVMAITKQGELMESDLNFFNDTVLEILNNLGIPAN